jgi:hypothetical protein
VVKERGENPQNPQKSLKNPQDCAKPQNPVKLTRKKLGVKTETEIETLANCDW